MKKFKLVSESEIANRKLLWDIFINYIETMYFSGAIEELDKKLISFEFENYKAYYLN
jgi:hypothetical protein